MNVDKKGRASVHPLPGLLHLLYGDPFSQGDHDRGMGDLVELCQLLKAAAEAPSVDDKDIVFLI